MKTKTATIQTSGVFFFKRVDRIEPSKELEPVSLTSSVSDIALFSPFPFADDVVLQLYHLPPLLPPPISTPFLPVLLMPARVPAIVLHHWTLKIQYGKI